MNQSTDPQKEIDTAIKLLDTFLGVEARKPGAAATLPAAIRVVETLEPAGGMNVPVFPASYLSDDDKPGYDLNGIEYGEPTVTIRGNDRERVIRPIKSARLCALDSPQSQANRMEPAFADVDELAKLVPQANATIPRRSGVNGEENLLRLPHRVADFRVRLSDQAAVIKNAIAKFMCGDALPLLRLMPTSILFGFWDSRGEGAKHARILLARIDAFNVIPCRRHAIYSGPYSKDEFAEVVLDDSARAKDKKDADKMAEQGFSNAPSEGLGGVIVEGCIERLSLLSLTDLGRIFCKGDDGKCNDELTNAARRYLFALAALAEGHTRSTGSHRLRSGCELVPAADKPEPRIELRGAGSTGVEADCLKKLYTNRRLLIEVAKDAMCKLSVQQSLKAFVVSKDSLKSDFTESPEAPTDSTAAENKPKPTGRKK